MTQFQRSLVRGQREGTEGKDHFGTELECIMGILGIERSDGLLTPHLNRAMDNGLTQAQAQAQAQASEMFTQLAFYAGWPNVFSAMPVAKAVFESLLK